MPYKQIQITVKYKGKGKIDPPQICNSLIAANVARYISDHNTILWTEEAFILCLNNNNSLIGWYRIAIGGIGTTPIDYRIIATIALKCTATGIILTHNHPCGNPLPSRKDIQTTRSLKTILDIIGITLIDHIIITDKDHFSIKEACLF